VIVFNDVNTFISPGDGDVNNQLMFQNLFTFSGSGPRSSRTGVMFYHGHSSGYFVGSDGGIFGSKLREAGATTSDYSGDFSSPIDPSMKVILLWLPNTTFTITEIN